MLAQREKKTKNEKRPAKRKKTHHTSTTTLMTNVMWHTRKNWYDLNKMIKGVATISIDTKQTCFPRVERNFIILLNHLK